MTSELPPGVVVEPIWVVEGIYGPDALERRRPVRAEHVSGMIALRDAGTVIESGAFTDGSGSMMLVRAEDEAAALRLFADDVYVRTGVWVELRARAFGRVARASEIPAAI